MLRCRCFLEHTGSRPLQPPWARNFRFSFTVFVARSSASKRPSTWASFQALPELSRLTWLQHQTSTGSRSRASSSPDSGSPGIHSPPRSNRTTGRPSSMPRFRISTASCTTSAPTSGLTSHSATSSRFRRLARPVRRPCRTRSTRFVLRTPSRTSSFRARFSIRLRPP